MDLKNNHEEAKNKNIATTQKNLLNEQHQTIAIAAYYKAENRGFDPGQDLNDWFEAEREVMGS